MFKELSLMFGNCSEGQNDLDLRIWICDFRLLANRTVNLGKEKILHRYERCQISRLNRILSDVSAFRDDISWVGKDLTSL